MDFAGKSLEGFIRKVHKSNPNCLIVILIFGINLAGFYNNHCHLSELYESIGKHYNLPVINLTQVLSQAYGLEYVKSLYDEQDHAHYTRPRGVQLVAQIIVEELAKTIELKSLKRTKKLGAKKNKLGLSVPIYPDNLENLNFIEEFAVNKFFTRQPKISVYQNTVFREKNYTIYSGNSLNFLLKGKLIAIFIKSDLNDGFIKIKFGQDSLVTSSYSSWVNKIKPQNIINLISSSLRQFKESADFVPVSISPCQEYPENFEIGFNKAIPIKQNPEKWKVSIIGIAYVGELKPIDNY